MNYNLLYSIIFVENKNKRHKCRSGAGEETGQPSLIIIKPFYSIRLEKLDISSRLVTLSLHSVRLPPSDSQ